MVMALGPDTMLDSSASDGFDRPSPRHLALPAQVDTFSTHASPPSSPQPSPRAAAPPPNPPFVFPARPSSASAPSSYSRATGRRPRSAVEGQERAFGTAETETRKSRSPALPDFSFNPGVGLSPSPENAFLSPPQSPQSPRAIPSRPTSHGHGHRRGGSEFVGGNIRAGEAITVMSTSPTKSESGFASPKLAPTELPERKGHGHRRSTAISSHDLSKILQPTSPNPVRGSSAPTSPSGLEPLDRYAFPQVSPEGSGPAASSNVDSADCKTDSVIITSPSITTENAPAQPVKEAPRARVGFSDTLEFIPRPLSLVSSDTSSTATARPGHSVSGSISSIISATNSTGADRENASPLGPSPSRKRADSRPSDSRPSTAGAILERTQSAHEPDHVGASPPRRRNSIPILASLPTMASSDRPAPSPTKAPKRWSFFGIEPFAGSSSPTRSRPVSANSSEPPAGLTEIVSSSTDPCSGVADESVPSGTIDLKPVPRKRSKKQKKVKTWAGSILTRKSKQRHVKHRPGSRRAPTPPPRRHSEVDDSANAAPATAAEPVMPTVLVTETSESTEDADSWRPPRPVSVPDDDTPYPMIDLDAALGPFNTPLPRDPEWEAAQRAGGLMKRPLHSAAGMSRFSGPGMHYQHRRAESAPEMVPFEAGRFGIHRFGSSSTMADVFEEDEEDEDDDKDENAGSATPQADSTSEQESNTTNVDDSSASFVENTQEEERVIPPHGIKRKGSGLSEEDGSQARLMMRAEPSASSLQEDVIMEEPNDLGISGSDGVCNTAAESSDSTPSPRQVFKGKDLAPVEISPLHLPTAALAPISPYSTTHSSAFPSPRSPMSYDANRISTAPSSITEDNFQSLLMGEPGPEVRISVDDIPSLTSSNSTMTRESAIAHQAQVNQPPFGDHQRPASFTSAAFGRRRSSLASLSRLISSSHGERSKLSMEISLESEQEKKPKVSKTKRLSRMMQFWKPRENTAT